MQRSKEKTKILFLVPVWGEAYCSIFTDICLPLIMTDGNLGYFRGRSDVCVLVQTTHADMLAISASPAWKRLQEMVPADFVVIDDHIDFSQPTYFNMSSCYQLGMKSDWVTLGHTAFVFLSPDSFWSNGTFRSIDQLLDRGYKAAMVSVPRTNMEKIGPFLAGEIGKNPANPVIPNRTLVGKAIEALHPMALLHEWKSQKFSNTWPQQIFWRTGPDSISLHCSYLHPLFVKSRDRWVDFKKAIDSDFIARMAYPTSSIYIATSSDVMMGVELSPADRDWGQPLAPGQLKSLMRFGFVHADRYHWHFFRHRIAFLGERPAYEDSAVTFDMDAVVNAVLRQSWVAQARRFGSRKLVKYFWRLLERSRALMPASVRAGLGL